MRHDWAILEFVYFWALTQGIVYSKEASAMSIIIPGSPLDMMVVKFANPMPQLLFDMLVASGWRVVAFGLWYFGI